MPGPLPTPAGVLDFWFSEEARARWFRKEEAFDAEVRRRLGAAAAAALEGRLDGWLEAPESALALVILLDQVPRNIHRGSALAFAADSRARVAAGRAIERGFDRRLPLDQRWLLYLPFEHSETLADQRRAVALFEGWAAQHCDGAPREAAREQVRYVRRHEEIIERFGRFPHRNAVLGRESTQAEIVFLREPNASF